MSIKIGKWVVICIGCAMALPTVNSSARYWIMENFRVIALHDHFSTSVFKAWPYSGSREENLNAFFRENKLIGMSRIDIHKALGTGEKLLRRNKNCEAYRIVSGVLINPGYFELQYTDDKVSAYRFRTPFLTMTPFLTSNP